MKVKHTLSLAFQPPSIQYDIIIGENILDELFAYAKISFSKALIITTQALYDQIKNVSIEKIVLPGGEGIKSRAMKAQIEDALIERGWGREGCLIAMGGGALLDLVGFVAATYCRGVAYISVPSTLIAMTDASIGGKTAVNVEEAKNWIGAFYHPKKIFLDLAFLRTLPDKEFVYGLAETIKHSLIADGDLFYFLERHLEVILQKQSSLIGEMVQRSCQIKKGIVERDPYESGLRRILNFGHTIGHALETLSEYSLHHGQGVIMGMWIELAIAHRMGFLSHLLFERIQAFLKRLPIHLDFPERIPFEMIKRDKKGAYKFVVLTAIGSVAPFAGEYVTPLTEELLEAGLRDVMCAYSKR